METKLLSDQEIFRNMCQAHDLSYVYSDDGKVYSNGEKQYKEIMEFSKKLPLDEAKTIWNEMVEKKVIKHCWGEYKWK
jgi:hypothetical protein